MAIRTDEGIEDVEGKEGKEGIEDTTKDSDEAKEAEDAKEDEDDDEYAVGWVITTSVPLHAVSINSPRKPMEEGVCFISEKLSSVVRRMNASVLLM